MRRRGKRGGPRGCRSVLLALWLPLALPAAAGAQLAGIDEMLAEGRFAAARTSLETWLAEEWERAGRLERQHGLWLRALLTIDPGLADLDYRRLAIEYPGGPWSDQALLRLAQGSVARGDHGAARQHLEILIRDYPQSPHRADARELLAGLDGVPEVPAPAEPPPPAGPERTQTGAFTVQLGAFADEERARALASEAAAAGLEVRVVQVPRSVLFRVRLGGFATAEEAEAGAEALRVLGFQAVVFPDRESEVAVP